jgi:aspartate dehydrogenase
MTGPLRVGVLGWGAIGRTVGGQIAAASRDGDHTLELTAVASRFSRGQAHELAVDPAEIGKHCDVVVEAAGPDAVRRHGEACLRDGADLLVVSLGALMDDSLRRRLVDAGPCRILLCTGAIGGLDLLAAARMYGPVSRITLETTKPSAALEREWMSEELLHALRTSGEAVECFRGTVAEAVDLFPESLNVSAALAIASGDPAAVEVAVIGSPTAACNTHDITIEAASGSYRFSLANRPDPDNPRTSHITAWAVLRALRNRAGAQAVFV